jgi:hypothetical protein
MISKPWFDALMIQRSVRLKLIGLVWGPKEVSTL